MDKKFNASRRRTLNPISDTASPSLMFALIVRKFYLFPATCLIDKFCIEQEAIDTGGQEYRLSRLTESFHTSLRILDLDPQNPCVTYMG